MSWKSYWQNWSNNFKDGWQAFDFFSSLFGQDNSSVGAKITNDEAVKISTGQQSAGAPTGSGQGNIWNDVTGQTNTNLQNAAAAALQEDAQQHQIDMLGYQNSASLNLARQMPAAQMEGLKSAGLNPALAAGNSFNSAVSSSGSGIANAQASNVSLLQSAANAAVTGAMIVKIFKMMAK